MATVNMAIFKANVTHQNPSLATSTPCPFRGFNCQEAGRVYNHVTTVIGCHMIGKLPIPRSNQELSG